MVYTLVISLLLVISPNILVFNPTKKMVNLMLQPVFMNLVKGSSDYKMTSDDLYNMWSVVLASQIRHCSR